MLSRLILSCTRVKPNKQCVVRCLVSDCKSAVFRVVVTIVFCLNFHPQLTGNLCQLMNLLVPKPKLFSDVTKAVFVLFPPPVKVSSPIKALVKYCPSSAISLHVTEHFETGFVRWVDDIHTTFFKSSRKQFLTISGYRHDQ